MNRENWGDLLTAKQAVDFLWAMLAGPDEGRREVDARFRKALKEALAIGRLPLIQPVPGVGGQLFERGALLSLARDKWPEKMRGVPAPFMAVGEGGARFGVSVSASVVPGTLPRCQQLLADAERRVAELEAEVMRLGQRLQQVEPMAARWQQFVTRSGSRGDWGALDD